jgi:hypothetical protein
MRTLIRVPIACIVLVLPTFSALLAADAPTPNLQSLARTLAGDWRLQVHLEGGTQTPKGFDGVGKETWRASAGDMTLTEEESMSAGPMNMIITGLFWTDQVTHELHALDCNNQNPHVCGIKDALDSVAVRWDGKELVVEEKEGIKNGEQMMSRIVWSKITPSSFTETGYFGPSGGPFQKGMTMVATKQ